jgi:hypothetical protein
VGVSDGGDFPRMTAMREPAFEFAADGAARGFMRAARFAGDEEHHPRALPDRAIKCASEVGVGAGEVVAVEVDGEVWLESAGADAAIPTGVEGLACCCSILSPCGRG